MRTCHVVPALLLVALATLGCDSETAVPVLEPPETATPSAFGLSEDTLHADPTLYAGKHSVVVLRAEAPAAAPHGLDLGGHGSDTVPYAIDEDLELELCAERISGVDYSVVVRNERSEEVLRLAGGDGCTTRILPAGVYFKELHYHSPGDVSPTIFLKPKYGTLDQPNLTGAPPTPSTSSHADPACKYIDDTYLKTPSGFLAYTHRYAQDYNRFVLRVDYPAMDGFSKWSLFNCGDGTFQLRSVATGTYVFELISWDMFSTTSTLFLESDVFEPEEDERYSFRLRGEYDSASNTLSLWFRSNYGTSGTLHYPYWYCSPETPGAALIRANMVLPTYDKTHCGNGPGDTKLLRLGLVGPSRGITIAGNCDGCNLSGINLFGFDLSHYSLRNATLDHATVVGSSFDGAQLAGASFDGAQLIHTSLTGAVLDGARLTSASGRIVNFADASLKGASLHDASFASAEHAGQSSTFEGTAFYLRGCHLKSLNNDTGAVVETGYVFIPGAQAFLLSSCPAEVCEFAARVAARPDSGSYVADCVTTTAPEGTLDWVNVGSSFAQAKVACTDFGGADLSYNPTLKHAIKTRSYDCRNSFAHATVPPDFETPDAWRYLDLSFTHIQRLNPAHFGDTLAGLDYSKAMMAGINLSHFELRSSVFDGADLSQATFIEADASFATFRGARLADSIFFGATLAGADFTSPASQSSLCTSSGYAPDGTATHTDFHGANFKTAVAPAAKFNNAFLSSADFSHALLAGADFGGAFLERCGLQATQTATVLNGANLDGASFASAQLRGVSFKEASLNQVSFAHQSLDSNRFTSAQLSGADFTSATLSGADLSGAVLLNASFNGATLSASDSGVKVDLSRSQLGGADFTDARFNAVDLSGALAPIQDVCPAEHILRPWSYWKYLGGDYQKIEVAYGFTNTSGVVYQNVECPVAPYGGACSPSAWLIDGLSDAICMPDPSAHPDNSEELVFADAAFETCLRETALRNPDASAYAGKITADLAAGTRHISCANRGIGVVNGTELARFVNLQTLNLSFNHLQELNLPPLALAQTGANFLTQLDLSHNQLTTVDLSGLKHLRYVNLESNLLGSLVLYANLHLYSLDLSDNLLTHVNLNFVPDLEYVDVSNNHLTSLASSTTGVANMLYLMYLSAANNDLTSIGNLHCLDVAFANKPGCLDSVSGNLAGLDLTGNKNLVCSSLGVSDRLLRASNCGN